MLKKKPHSAEVAIWLSMPEVGLEPTWTQGPLDFESSASTDFTTPATDSYSSTFPWKESRPKHGCCPMFGG